MAYQISAECTGCHNCIAQCPTQAISVEDGEIWLNPLLCNNCEGFFPEPQCVVACPESVVQPYESIKGRTKSIVARIRSNPPLFLNGKTQVFASSILIWETCNLLAQSENLQLVAGENGILRYQKPVLQNLGSLTLCRETVADSSDPQPPWDLRAACLHLIFAGYAVGLDNPWQDHFVCTDQQIESYLGWEKRKDLSKIERLTLLKDWVEQVCQIHAAADWPAQGKVNAFAVPLGPMWKLLKVHHHFQKDDQGCNHLVGLTWVIQPGEWARFFLNREGHRQQAAFYQYSHLPLSLLHAVMRHWQHHPGSIRMLLWLLFKVRMGRQQRVTVQTLMRVAYGESRLQEAHSQTKERKRMVRMFESDLEILSQCGLHPIFDPDSYPAQIRPLWSRLEAIPDDAEEALDFWIDDANQNGSLTASSPRGKWGLLMQARIQQFDLPKDWYPQADPSRDLKPKPSRRKSSRRSSKPPLSQSAQPSPDPNLCGAEISAARRQRGISQRELAQQIGKSQSWVRDVENERFRIGSGDQKRLSQALELDPQQRQA